MEDKSNSPQFKLGDAVVHPTRGAGVVTGFKRFNNREGEMEYYKIKLLDAAGTRLMIPVAQAEETGLRPATPHSRLEAVWDVLEEEPQSLTSNHRSRQRELQDRLETGDILQVAEAVRDIAWRRRETEGLTVNGQRLYNQALRLLASEIAASEGIDVEEVRSKIHARLRKNFDDFEEM